ncbi:uncharacterized protein ctdsp1 isoform X1 [Pygocentrus nattereri]|uniref:protein-serine/threonine phosphatase n=1 Tax=Pygocentrus nattereri TaxID=42514 RepID=A0A3B4E247_PYGNA|nr:uncharacterized protein ctdsp1 isoform X1 [Pygocentrus nattereri]
MSTCALLLSSQAACGLSKSTFSHESPLQADLQDPCPPAGLCRLCEENKPVSECLECLTASELCKSFGESKSFVRSNITKYLESSTFFRSKCIEANMPAELFDPSKVSQQGYPKESLEVAAESRMISAEKSVDFMVHQTISGLMQPDGDYTENGQFNGELVEVQDRFDSSENSSLFDYDLERSESLAISTAFVSLEEKRLECSIESQISEQTQIAEHDTEPFTLLDVMPDLCKQVDTEIPELVSADFDTLYEHEAEFEGPSEEYYTSDGSEEITVSDLYERYSTHSKNTEFDLDSQPCGYLEQCRLNNQNMPSECHTTHFELSELCQASREIKPAWLSGSLDQQPPAEQRETIDDSELNPEIAPGSYTNLFESTAQSQVSDEHTLEQTENYTQQELFNYNQLSENNIMPVQCSSCGRYFEKCKIPEQCSPSESADPSENPQQSGKCLELCESSGTQCSVFHTSELPKENPPMENNQVRKDSDCDTMFFGSMETFEARWLSQFLDDHCQQNTFGNHADLSVAITEPNDELITSESNDDSEPVIEASDGSAEQRTLCGVCERREKGQFHYDEPTQLFKLCGFKAGALELGSEESRAKESVVKAGSLDESSEEEYADCIDSKSQSSSETDESFKSFADEPETFEIYPDHSDDSKALQNFCEEDEAYEHYTVHSEESYELCDGHDACELYGHDMVDTYEEIHTSCSEQKVIGNEVYKTYAEALSSGLSVENGEGHEPCTECTEAGQGESYSLNLNAEGTTPYGVEGWGSELSEETEVSEPYEEVEGEADGLPSEAEDTCKASSGDTTILENCSRDEDEAHGLPSKVEDTYETLSEDALDPCSLECMCHDHEIDTCEIHSEKINTAENKVSEHLTEEVTQDPIPEKICEENENETHQLDLTDETTVNENCEVYEAIDEVEGAHGPCCGEIETSEDDEASIFGFEEVAIYIEEPTLLNEKENVQNGDQELLIMENGIEVQSNENEELMEPCGETETEDYFPAQSKCSEKLEDLIHQVSRCETTEHSEDSTAFKPASQQKADNEEEEPSEDSEASDDEFPESCDCEFCVPSVDQVPAKPLLPQIKSQDAGKICVVIDLDETLVHSSFKPVNNADFIIPVEIDGAVHQVYVLKRPHVDEFLKRMGELFECVLFTASLAKYADPVSDLLDKWGAFRCRLFRESCVFHRGNYVKDLSRLGRDLNKVIIVDNSPASYIFHPDNAVPVASWFDDMSDTELLDLIPFFERLSKVDDVYAVLKQQRTSS